MNAITAVKERPILFSGEMVRAILASRKTQSRRVVKLPPFVTSANAVAQSYDDRLAALRASAPNGPESAYPLILGSRYEGQRLVLNRTDDVGIHSIACPYGQRGDRLWVRESWEFLGTDMNKWGRTHRLQTGVVRYLADDTRRRIETDWQSVEKWMARRAGGRPSIHMPRWASRITLEITDVRVQRLQELSWQDCRAEGVNAGAEVESGVFVAGVAELMAEYRTLWDSLNAKRGFGWEINPWVWAISFSRVHE